jgi:hypothetical protein
MFQAVPDVLHSHPHLFVCECSACNGIHQPVAFGLEPSTFSLNHVAPLGLAFQHGRQDSVKLFLDQGLDLGLFDYLSYGIQNHRLDHTLADSTNRIRALSASSITSSVAVNTVSVRIFRRTSASS